MRPTMNRAAMRVARALACCLVAAILTAPAASAQGGSGKGAAPAATPVVTFVELGSVRCIPCKKMQPVMKAIEEKYRGTVKVVFHDVWTEEGKAQGEKYNVRLIPTQVFLDAAGKEFYRHEGFLPEQEIHKLLKRRGLKPGA